jgi:hypothetical protein
MEEIPDIKLLYENKEHDHHRLRDQRNGVGFSN